MAQLRARILVSGVVQGVNFRAYARQVAHHQGLCGWVRNRADGKVEAVVEGEASALQGFIGWCRHGPPTAHVSDVQVTWEPYQGEFQAFVIRG